jgi:hypothetical protein
MTQLLNLEAGAYEQTQESLREQQPNFGQSDKDRVKAHVREYAHEKVAHSQLYPNDWRSSCDLMVVKRTGGQAANRLHTRHITN